MRLEPMSRLTEAMDHPRAVMPTVTSHFATVDGFRHHYLEIGEGRGPLVTCVHGLSRNARDFLGIGSILGEELSVRAIDVRGRGESAWGPREAYRFETYADDLLALLDHWGAERTSLLGTSMGGIISLLFAARHPERVDRIVLNDIGCELDPVGMQRIAETMREAPASFTDLDAVVAYFRSYFPPIARFSDDEVAEFAASSLKPTASGLIWRMDPAVRLALRDALAEPPTFDLWHVFDQIRAPILILRGQDSDVLARDTLNRMLKRKRGAEGIEVPGVGHAPLLTEAVSIAALRRFFELRGGH